MVNGYSPAKTRRTKTNGTHGAEKSITREKKCIMIVFRVAIVSSCFRTSCPIDDFSMEIFRQDKLLKLEELN